MKIEARTFSLPDSYSGQLTTETITEHINLYNGYVKNTNYILEKIQADFKKPEENTYEIGELYRRFSFEYNGVKNHELFFEQLEGGASTIPIDSKLYTLISETYGTWNEWVQQFTTLAKTRGIGWAVLWYDSERNAVYNSWVDEQHLGQLNGCHFIYGIDMWEHSYVHDYLPSGKALYIKEYIDNTNWNTVASRLQ